MNIEETMINRRIIRAHFTPAEVRETLIGIVAAKAGISLSASTVVADSFFEEDDLVIEIQQNLGEQA